MKVLSYRLYFQYQSDVYRSKLSGVTSHVKKGKSREVPCKVHEKRFDESQNYGERTQILEVVPQMVCSFESRCLITHQNKHKSWAITIVSRITNLVIYVLILCAICNCSLLHEQKMHCNTLSYPARALKARKKYFRW